MNNFQTFLSKSTIEIEQEVTRVLDEWSSVVSDKTPMLAELNDLFKQQFYGGKYIRGTLAKLGFEMTGGKTNNEILKIAAAFEILHTSLLIHDDIIDNSFTRRGKPTIHSVFKNSHYGMSQAICFGDIGFFLATKLIAESDLSIDVKNKITSHFSQIALQTMLGEMLDVKTSFEKIKKEKDVITIYKLKTAYYTISAPLSVGAMMANASQKQLDAIKMFGENLGIAYQIQDDILGVFGNEKKLGKSTSSDIKENKNTLLISYALKKATLKQKQFLKKYYGAKALSQKQLDKIKTIFIETGALNYSQITAEKYVFEANNIIPSITDNLKYQKYLLQFSEFIVKRKK
jgi:geranylgeranyl pyrophosphate synthase